MYRFNNSKGTPAKRTGSKNKINLDYDYNTEYGDGDIPYSDYRNSAVNETEYSEETDY